MKIVCLIFLSVLSIVGCGHSSPYVSVKDTDPFDHPYLQYFPPVGGWVISKKSDIAKGIDDERMYFYKDDLPGISYDLKIITKKFKPRSIDKYYDPENDFKGYIEFFDNNPKSIKIREEQKIHYREHFVAYINGLKCLGRVISRGWLKDVASIQSKIYDIDCYYHTTYGEKRHLGIYYTYQYVSNPSKMMKDKNYKGPTMLTDEVEADFKLRIKHFIRSIKIKDIDTEKTKIYDREFESSKF